MKSTKLESNCAYRTGTCNDFPCEQCAREAYAHRNRVTDMYMSERLSMHKHHVGHESMHNVSEVRPDHPMYPVTISITQIHRSCPTSKFLPLVKVLLSTICEQPLWKTHETCYKEREHLKTNTKHTIKV